MLLLCRPSGCVRDMVDKQQLHLLLAHGVWIAVACSHIAVLTVCYCCLTGQVSHHHVCGIIAKHLCMQVWGMATLGFEPGEAFLASVAEAAIKAIPELNPQNLRCVAYKYNVINFQPNFTADICRCAPGIVLPLQRCQLACMPSTPPCTMLMAHFVGLLP